MGALHNAWACCAGCGSRRPLAGWVAPGGSHFSVSAGTGQDLARRHRPDSDGVTRSVLHALLVVYVKLCCIRAQAPWYAEQAMEYAKKFYHLCYRRWYVPVFASMESKLGPETTGVIIRAYAGQDYLTPPADFEPELGFDEFMGILRTEEYDPDRIFDVWERMSESPELRALMDANEETGACARGYRERR